ncbi:MAG TPA: hypothetical protein VNO17_03145 [Actinomycetota bacterium]|nr:hypothetical protein [Actinomycetota bacterium]
MPGSFIMLVAALALIEGFFLLRPAISSGPYYRPRNETGYSYWYLVIAAFVPYAAALRAHRHGDRAPFGLLFGTAVVLHVALIFAPASRSQDVYQSLLYGKMALHGTNPYVVAPRSVGDPWGLWALWPNTPSPYGPAWTLLCSAIVVASRTHLTAAFLLLKAMAAACTMLATWLLVRAHRSGAPRADTTHDDRWAVLAFAYNPLVLFSSGLGAHPGVVIAVAFAGAVLAERRGRDVWTTLLLTVAGLVKAYAVLPLLAWLIALAWRRGVVRAAGHAVVAMVVAAATYAPFSEGARTFDGLRRAASAASSSLTGTLVRIGSGELADAVAAGRSAWGHASRWLLLLGILAVALHLARSPRVGADPWAAAALLLTTYVVLTPWYLPWHLLGLLALSVLVPQAPTSAGALVFSGTSLFVGSGGNAPGLMFQAAVRYGPPALAVVRRRGGNRSSGGPW